MVVDAASQGRAMMLTDRGVLVEGSPLGAGAGARHDLSFLSP